MPGVPRKHEEGRKQMRRSVEVSYIEYWVIRVIRDTKTCKTAVKEIEYPAPPTEQDIVEVLMACEPNEFVTVEHNYRR